jgi:hypothetical protein
MDRLRVAFGLAFLVMALQPYLAMYGWLVVTALPVLAGAVVLAILPRAGAAA